MKKIVFDFDDTLSTFDTIFPFLYFANNDSPFLKGTKKGLCVLYRGLYRFKLISNYQLKNWAVKLFIGRYTKEQIQESSKLFFEKISFHENVYSMLVKYVQDEDAEVYISTASFDDYIVLLKEEFPNLIIQASSLQYSNNKVTGIQQNNYGQIKAAFFQDDVIDVLFTDSYSDKALALQSKEIRFVSSHGEVTECRDFNHFVEMCNNR